MREEMMMNEELDLEALEDVNGGFVISATAIGMGVFLGLTATGVGIGAYAGYKSGCKKRK